MSESPLPQNKELQESDLRALIAAGARENRFLEFKREYLPDTDAGKRKFLQSVSAFANTRGGDLILGMEEANGVATAPSPLGIADPDQARLQIQNLIRVHLRPALGGVQVQAVALTGGGHVIVVRVPKSWAGPHMLTYGDEKRFFIRDDGGKRPMDYEEVRDSFLAGETTGARLRNFRMERCAAILNGETPRPLAHSARIVLHLLPLDMFALPRRFDVRGLYLRCEGLRPIEPLATSSAFDVDGCFAFNPTREGPVLGYAYLFRSGALEAVDAYMLSPWQEDKGKMIPSRGFEERLIQALEAYLRLLTSLEVAPPFAVFLSLLNVRDYFMATGSPFWESHGIGRDHLYVPESVFDAVPSSIASAMFPVFNSVWNACGLPQSLNYDEQGNWVSRK